ncbi:hypothetical protein [Microvirga mediterraneensis]|uniref:Uncharacterized protein n=1 Tax=Microvirga mediterraneensis TaxID=2754695 RepID=A0A838BK84_9HYPH|nr:hypothetical protein [Microvirga mediterraneensis]MBA1155142.1 hypothetical protein [Microvirga mediterraneensis]
MTENPENREGDRVRLRQYRQDRETENDGLLQSVLHRIPPTASRLQQIPPMVLPDIPF